MSQGLLLYKVSKSRPGLQGPEATQFGGSAPVRILGWAGWMGWSGGPTATNLSEFNISKYIALISATLVLIKL